MDIAAGLPELLGAHRGVRGVRLVGSRAAGRPHDFSDWDFAVETHDFELVARDLPRLVAPLRPLAEQWDPYASHACYMLMLPGPVKIDLLFLEERREWPSPWKPSPATLEPIDRHFWDWIVWLEQKRSAGHEDVLATGLRDMHNLMLEPMGVAAAPQSVPEAIDAYLKARSALERKFGLGVPRELEAEVRPAVLRRH